MFKYFLSLSLALSLGTFAYAMPSTDDVRSILNQGVPNGFAAQLGTQVTDHKVQLMKAKYKFSKQGGASVVLPSIFFANLLDTDNTAAKLPNKAVVKQVLVDVMTTPVASAAAGFSTPQFAVGLNTANDLLPFTAVASLSGRVDGTPVNTAATMVKAVAASNVKLYLKGGSVTSGEFNVFIEYYLSD